ncbi:MAG TPA: carboxypeptidase-like regulatory domain-containing protein [Pyrinomonadaceae bacterium]|nr:carboxypeptidase-like regulatory domain-containing protein [Pyrinomonadaceae bacterium]
MSRIHWRTCLALLAAVALGEAGFAAPAPNAPATPAAGERRTSLGTISGTVLDSRGKPVAGALVKILRDGLNEVVKETKSATDGTFSTRVTPGRYLIRALAAGFTPATFSAVQIAPSSELVYRFNLQPVGEGNTLPERRADRNDPKFRIRSSISRRSVFNAGEADEEMLAAALGRPAALPEAATIEAGSGDEPVDGVAPGSEAAEPERRGRARARGFVETFFADSADPRVGAYGGLNFAVAAPVTRELEMIFAGQAGQFERFEATARLRAGTRHRLSATVGGARTPVFAGGEEKSHFAAPGRLGQVSVRAVDEWVVRDGVVLVVGLDYSRFLGAGGADSFSPRLGFAFDVDARTRLHAAYAPGTDAAEQLTGIDFEDGPVLFRESPGQTVALVDGEAVMERKRRLEFGVERVVSENSTVEATAFFDTVDSRGVGLLSAPLEGLSGAGDSALLDIASQQGGARGLRVVYTRRISQHLKASAGYAFGRGQRLSPSGTQDGPAGIFRSAFFQTAAAQLDATVTDDTTVRTVLRFSPRAAVFAIDPFAGRLAVYDPSLSILVTHELPTFGLPLRAQATLDARNVFDLLTGFEDGETSVSLGALRRGVRGGISVRF